MTDNVIATLGTDLEICPVQQDDDSFRQILNLVNYKIRTEGEILKSKSNNVQASVATDLGKQLLLHAKDGSLDGVKTLMTRGAPFTSDWLGMTALHFAAMNNQYEMCEVLMKGGLNKDSRTKADRTPLHLATFYGHERIVRLLLGCKCSVNPLDMLRMTPLHWAVEKGFKSIVRLLLKHNADVTIVSKFGNTPIALAVKTEQTEIMADLRNAKLEQERQKLNAADVKEVNEAVDALMSVNGMPNSDSDGIEFSEIVEEDTTSNHTTRSRNDSISNLDNISEAGVLDNNTINLLKSHGISMMPDEDKDGSKDMLSTALQNGRQLVLSEGGKLLLHETQQRVQSINNNNLTLIPSKDKSEDSKESKDAKKQLQLPSILNKVAAQKSKVRIISFDEFRKMYNETDLKTLRSATSSPSSASSNLANAIQGSSRLRNGSSPNSFNLPRNSRSLAESILNSNLRPTMHRQIKITPMKTSTTIATRPQRQETTENSVDSGGAVFVDNDNATQIIEIGPEEFGTQACSPLSSESEEQRRVEIRPSTVAETKENRIYNKIQTTTLLKLPNTSPEVLIESTAKSNMINENQSLMKPENHQSSRGLSQQAKQPPNSHLLIQESSHRKTRADDLNSGSDVNKYINSENRMCLGSAPVKASKPGGVSAPKVLNILTLPEMSRQLSDLRKENDDLRRHVGHLEMQNEDLIKRVTRLEELLLSEHSNEVEIDGAYEIYET